jgi:hypothetical protein
MQKSLFNGGIKEQKGGKVGIEAKTESRLAKLLTEIGDSRPNEVPLRATQSTSAAFYSLGIWRTHQRVSVEGFSPYVSFGKSLFVFNQIVRTSTLQDPAQGKLMSPDASIITNCRHS